MNFLISKNLIKAETAKSVLIKIPKSDYCFWVSRKLLKNYKNSLSLYAGEDYTFKAFIKTKSKMIGINELQSVFQEVKSEYETHIPKPLEVQQISAIDELKDE